MTVPHPSDAPAGVAGAPSRPSLNRAARGVLAVHAHPDDETLSTGALLATSAVLGVPALVVTCTRGERGEVLALPGTASEGRSALEGNGPALAAYRERELSAALLALGGGRPGAIRHLFLDDVPPAGERFEDSGMVWVAPGVAGPDPSVAAGFAVVPLDDAALRLARVIREVRPSVVATYEAGGGYGHPDHVRAHRVAARAVELAADAAVVVPVDGPLPGAAVSPDSLRGGGELEPWTAELWQRVTAADALRGGRAVLAADPRARSLAREARLTFATADEPLPAVARDATALAGAAADGRLVEVDVEPVLPAVVAAMRAHATQIQHAAAVGDPAGAFVGWYALSNGVLAPIGPAEAYLVEDGARGRPASVGSARERPDRPS